MFLGRDHIELEKYCQLCGTVPFPEFTFSSFRKVLYLNKYSRWELKIQFTETLAFEMPNDFENFQNWTKNKIHPKTIVIRKLFVFQKQIIIRFQILRGLHSLRNDFRHIYFLINMSGHDFYQLTSVLFNFCDWRFYRISTLR